MTFEEWIEERYGNRPPCHFDMDDLRAAFEDGVIAGEMANYRYDSHEDIGPFTHWLKDE